MKEIEFFCFFTWKEFFFKSKIKEEKKFNGERGEKTKIKVIFILTVKERKSSVCINSERIPWVRGLETAPHLTCPILKLTPFPDGQIPTKKNQIINLFHFIYQRQENSYLLPTFVIPKRSDGYRKLYIYYL